MGCKGDLYRYLPLLQQAEFLCAECIEYTAQLADEDGLRRGNCFLLTERRVSHPTHEDFFELFIGDNDMEMGEMSCIYILLLVHSIRRSGFLSALTLCLVGDRRSTDMLCAYSLSANR